MVTSVLEIDKSIYRSILVDFVGSSWFSPSLQGEEDIYNIYRKVPRIMTIRMPGEGLNDPFLSRFVS